MPHPEYFIPIYKTCPECKGRGGRPILKDSIWTSKCPRCEGTGTVKVLIQLEEFASLTDMDEVALSNLYGHLSETD